MRWRLVVLGLLFYHCITAQQYYETYTPANGLVDARINRIIQDGSGRLYFLTRNGLSIFDGQRFNNYTAIGNQTIGLIDDGFLLPDGNVLLATFGGKWIHGDKKGIRLDGSGLPALSEISEIIPMQNGEQLLVSNHGLFRLREKRLQPFDVSIRKIAGADAVIDRVCVSGNYLLFNFSNDPHANLYCLDARSGRLTDSLRLPNLFALVPDQAQQVFGCTAEGIIQLDSLLLREGKLAVRKPWFHSLIPSRIQIANLYFDLQHNCWLIDNIRGCVKLDLDNGNVSSYNAADGLLPGTGSIFQDKENNYWFIAHGKGVQKLVQTNYEMIRNLGSVNVERVSMLNGDNSGTQLFVSNDQLYLSRNGQARVVNRDKTPFNGAYFSWQQAAWWFTTADTLRADDGSIIPFKHSEQLPVLTPSSHSAIDAAGSLLIAGNSIGWIGPDRKASIAPLPYFADNISIVAPGDYWAFCRSNDVVHFNVIDGQLKKTATFNYHGLGPRYAIHWNRDTFCIGTRENGLLFATVTEKGMQVISQIGRAQGLSNDFVEVLLRIDDHRLAVGTASGLDILVLSGHDTLIENVSARISHFEPILQLARDKSGQVYARTENYQLFRYDPSGNIITPGYQPDAWFDQLRVNDRLIDEKENRFSHTDNNFLFSAASPSFTDNRSILFRFLLKNEKREWKQESNKAVFEISNLPSGTYELTVVIRYPGRIYPDKVLTWKFIIRPPFWKTWWFITGLLIVIFLTGWRLTRSYLRRQLNRQQIIMEKELAIEQERTRVARELHDGLGSMLSGVKHSFSAMKKDIPLDLAADEKFQYNIDRLNESINELRNITHSMASDTLLKYGLENSLRDYCRNISQHGGPAISFEALSMEKVSLNQEQSFHLFRIIQELLQNILKHSKAKQAIVQLSYNSPRLYITVEDDGQGFDLLKNEQRTGLGLISIANRVKILKGKIDIRSAPGKGTSVLIEIPCGEKK